MGKELILLERSNGWYGGYESVDGEYVQLFNTDSALLFLQMKRYTDKGYRVKCLDKTKEKEFMDGRMTLEACF